MMSVAIMRWLAERWRETPGYRGGAILVLGIPTLFYLPLDEAGIFDEWRQGAAVIGWIGATALAISLGRDTARAERWHVWLFQKGVTFREYAFGAWLFDLAAGCACIAWWVIAWVPANALRGAETFPHAVALLALMTAAYLLSLSVLFLIGSTGSSRGVELVVLTALLSLLSPVLVRASPAVLAKAVEVLIPPFLGATDLHAGVRDGSATLVVNTLLHFLTYVGACLAIAYFLLGRRRPQL